MDVDALYTHLFSQESDLMKRVFEERKHESKKFTSVLLLLLPMENFFSYVPRFLFSLFNESSFGKTQDNV